MKIAFIFPPMLLGGRPLDFANLWDDPRGTTGSEIMTLSFALGLAELGHDVTMFIENPNREFFDESGGFDSVGLRGAVVRAGKVLLRSFNGAVDSPMYDALEGFDVVISALDPNVLRPIPVHDTTPLRVVMQQLNDFNYGAPSFDEFVDVYVSPSEAHRQHMIATCPQTKADKWVVVSNGCEFSAIRKAVDGERAKEHRRRLGRVLYVSSPDRGLHLLLQEWPAIRKAVPHAELRIFYYSLAHWLADWTKFSAEDPSWHPFYRENWRRANYIDRALKVLKGVTVVGSVSRRQMYRELAVASAVAYPCDPIAWTEGFSCATMEACAAGAVPIISTADALGQIYRGATPMVASPAWQHMTRFRELVIQALTDEPWRSAWEERGMQRAAAHDWESLAKELEAVILERRRQV